MHLKLVNPPSNQSLGPFFSSGRSRQAMKEKGSRPEINGEMEGLPQPATESDPEVGGNDDGGDQIQRNGAGCIFDWLAWGVHRIKDGAKCEPSDRQTGRIPHTAASIIKVGPFW